MPAPWCCSAPVGPRPQAAAPRLCVPQASERRLRPLPQKQRTLHEKILEEIKQERKLRPVETQYRGQKGTGSASPVLRAMLWSWGRSPVPRQVPAQKH